MRTHKDILRDAGHEAVASATARPITTVKSWAQRNAIPSWWWQCLVSAGFASVDELAATAQRKDVAV